MEQGEGLRISFVRGPDGTMVRLRAGTGLGSCEHRLDEDRIRIDFEDDLTPAPAALKTRDDAEVEALGSTLFGHVFASSEARSLFDKSVERRRQGGGPIRLEFEFDLEAPELQWLQGLPWEMCYSLSHCSFLAQDRSFSIVRTVRSPEPSMPWPSSRAPRCLIASASPGKPPQRYRLKLEEENAAIAKELDEAGVDHETLRHATLALLREELLDRSYGVLHLAGHGYRRTEEGGRLHFGVVLEDPMGGEDRIDSEDFGKWLADTGIGLVVLNSCWSAAESSRRSPGPFHGVAQRLVRLGIPAVLAMQRPINDTAATTFSCLFFRRLVRGDSIEEALTETRKALSRRRAWRQQWMIPALFLHSPGRGVLFQDLDTQPQPKGVMKAASAPHVKLSVQRLGGKRTTVCGLDVETPGALPEGLGDQPVKVEVKSAEGEENIITGKKFRVLPQRSEKEL